MSKMDEKMAAYQASMAKINVKPDEELLQKVAKGLGPSIYNNDSNKVACSEKSELERVVKNFCMKKLGMTDEAKAMQAVQDVCKQYTERSKHRAVFYYLLVKHLGMEGHYA